MLTPEQKREHLDNIAGIRKLIAEGDVSTAVILLLNLCTKLLEQLGPSEHAQAVAEAMRHEKP